MFLDRRLHRVVEAESFVHLALPGGTAHAVLFVVGCAPALYWEIGQRIVRPGVPDVDEPGEIVLDCYIKLGTAGPYVNEGGATKAYYTFPGLLTTAGVGDGSDGKSNNLVQIITGGTGLAAEPDPTAVVSVVAQAVWDWLYVVVVSPAGCLLGVGI